MLIAHARHSPTVPRMPATSTPSVEVVPANNVHTTALTSYLLA
jgi:hypothetical protein